MALVSSFLSNLPSKGCFSKLGEYHIQRSARPHVSAYETAPPACQVVSNDQVNPLIRALHKSRTKQLKLSKSDESPVKFVAEQHSVKRPLEAVYVSPFLVSPSPKRQHMETSTDVRQPDLVLDNLEKATIAQLKDVLKKHKEKISGNKAELLARARQAQQRVTLTERRVLHSPVSNGCEEEKAGVCAGAVSMVID
eukprot:GILK01010831.1.p1 GENE.GILK01010831.1~~GILK01010831.1.p1  ORF type:complete len:195 (+),score=36.31 GILK01010831.1:59-643(+)